MLASLKFTQNNPKRNNIICLNKTLHCKTTCHLRPYSETICLYLCIDQILQIFLYRKETCLLRLTPQTDSSEQSYKLRMTLKQLSGVFALSDTETDTNTDYHWVLCRFNGICVSLGLSVEHCKPTITKTSIVKLCYCCNGKPLNIKIQHMMIKTMAIITTLTTHGRFFYNA